MMDYKNTVFLPKTSFSMKAGLAQREPELIKFWEEKKLYERLRQKSKGRKKFILHFGPPFANGHPHIGHALTYVLKDIVTKTYQMMGYDAPLVPGWDCHGLPIEWKIEQAYREKGLSKDHVSKLDFIKECRAFAEKWMEIQKQGLERLGIIADWQNPYVTMEPKTEAKITELLLRLLMKGLLYRGLKPVLWSVVEKTALAEAEVEYRDHTSDSVYVTFKVTESKLSPLGVSLVGAGLVIWTTTPWTLPGNRAIAYGRNFDYCLIKALTPTAVVQQGHRLVVAKDLLSSFCQKIGLTDYTVLATFKGNQLEGTICQHPFSELYNFPVPALAADHVTVDSGTGLVHTAPGHGVEDFELGKACGLEIPATVQGDGTYYDHVPLFAGQHIYKVTPQILEALASAGALLCHDKITHSYPHSWRSKSPLIYRATSQWFLDIETLRKQALSEIDEVEWFPAQGKNRIRSMVENRADWCLSRQRLWGTPLALFIDKKTQKPLQDEQVNQRIIDAIAKEGIEAWYLHESSFFLGEAYCPEDYEKVTDTIDVWFDSASSQEFVLKQRPELTWPADVYFEGSDQHRGWFQSSLIVSTALNGKAPYKQVVTHGFVLDEKGYKMSKSANNVLDPQDVINTMGADLLRLWIVGCDYTQDLRIGAEILKHQQDIYRRLRNTLRYLLGALDQYTDKEAVPYAQLPELEQWILHRLGQLDALHHRCIKNYDFSTFYAALHNFCASDLSAFYFDIRKDCLYCDSVTSLKRRSTRTLLNSVFLHLVHWLAPALSFTAEEAWQAYQRRFFNPLTEQDKEQEAEQDFNSIHEQEFIKLDPLWNQPELFDKWSAIRDIRRVITNALELERSAKTIGSSLQAHVVVYTSLKVATLLQGVDLAELAITSQAQLVTAQPPAGAVTLEDVADVGVVVNLASGQKCERCWRVLPEVGVRPARVEEEDLAIPQTCHRCREVVKSLKN